MLHDNVGQQVRAACAQYRELKKCNSTFARCIEKASLAEKSQIDAELSCLQLDASDFSQPGEPEQPNAAETEGPTETADKSPLVHVDKSAVVTVAKPGAFEIPMPDIYTRVLAKKDSDVSTPSKRLRRKMTLLENNVSSGLALVPVPPSPPYFPRFYKGTTQGMNLRRQNVFVEDANEELLGWTMQEATMFQAGSQFDWSQAFLCEDVPRHGYSGQLLYPLPLRPLLFRPPNSRPTFEKARVEHKRSKLTWAEITLEHGPTPRQHPPQPPPRKPAAPKRPAPSNTSFPRRTQKASTPSCSSTQQLLQLVHQQKE